MIQEQIASVIQRERLIRAGETVVVGVSGGVDSVTLLHILSALRDRFDFGLHVASLDHGLRGEAGQDDLAFARRLAATWGLGFTGETVDVRALASRDKIGLEAAARRSRYAFLAGVARELGASTVAVGHHAQDQAETLLMNLLRGAGMQGMRGMRFSSPLPSHEGCRLIRPLLHLSRREIAEYAARHGLAYRYDESNDDLAYTRNYLRHRVLPPLLERQPKALEAFARLAETAATDDAYLTQRFQQDILPQVRRADGRWTVAADDLHGWHDAMRRRFLRAAFHAITGVDLSHAATLDALDWTNAATTGKRLDLGRGVQLRCAYGQLHVERRGLPIDDSGYRLIRGRHGHSAGSRQPKCSRSGCGWLRAGARSRRAAALPCGCHRDATCGCGRGGLAIAFVPLAWAGARASSRTG